MNDLDKAFIELRRRIRDIPMEKAIEDSIVWKDVWGNIDRRKTNETINIVGSVISIYREAIFARMDSVQEAWNE